ncbi:MAG: T9SS type A sorting domain-containing protein [Saprospiraceae bacterium]|nr:T9SS type A sorting domain-containing protein [Saprospiraceae bacterium]
MDTSITVGRVSTYSDFVKDTARYRAVTKILSDDKRRSTGTFSDMIDHIIVSNELSSSYISGSVGVGTSTSLNFIGAYLSTTTDHFPVWASFNPKRISTSTRELPMGQGIKNVYPNPTSGVLTIEFALDTEGLLEVRNLLGITLFSQKLKNAEGLRTQIVDIAAASSGLYLITLSTAKGVSTRLISKM